MQMMKAHSRHTNINERERIASALGGGALAAFGLLKRGAGGYSLAAIGGAMLWRGVTGHCDFYQALGFSTANRLGRSISIPYELGIRVDKEIHIAKPAEEIYSFWREIPNLARFMNHVEDIRVTGDRRSHWIASGPAGMRVEWEAEIINDIPGKLIAWRSLEGADVDNAGSVHFEPAGDGTLVKVELQYNPPAGALGAVVARLLGDDPARQLDDDLRRLKELMEHGEIRNKALQMSERSGLPGGRMWDRDKVQESSQESFPASDPPSWTPSTL